MTKNIFDQFVTKIVTKNMWVWPIRDQKCDQKCHENVIKAVRYKNCDHTVTKSVTKSVTKIVIENVTKIVIVNVTKIVT